MLEQPWQKRAVAIRRERRAMTKDGWEHLGEGGGKLWEMYRGGRVGHQITDVRIAADGISLWIKTAPAPVSALMGD